MNKAKRSAVIAGNWKMNMTPAETTDFMKALAPKVADVKEAKVVLCVPFVDIAPDTASAATSTWNGSVDTSFSGSGTAGNPYVISSAAELAGLSQLVNNNSNWSKNKHFVLTTDIDLGSRERYEVYDDAPQRDFLRKVTGAE